MLILVNGFNIIFSHCYSAAGQSFPMFSTSVWCKYSMLIWQMLWFHLPVDPLSALTSTVSGLPLIWLSICNQFYVYDLLRLIYFHNSHLNFNFSFLIHVAVVAHLLSLCVILSIYLSIPLCELSFLSKYFVVLSFFKIMLGLARYMDCTPLSLGRVISFIKSAPSLSYSLSELFSWPRFALIVQDMFSSTFKYLILNNLLSCQLTLKH